MNTDGAAHGPHHPHHPHPALPPSPVTAPSAAASAAAAAGITTEVWDLRSAEQARVYCTAAQLSAAMNEAASTQFNRWHNWSIVAISILTVITGSQSIPALSDASSDSQHASSTGRSLSIVVALCSICLGALASIVARMDWRGRAVLYAKRSVGYGRLAGEIRLELTLPLRDRRPARGFFEAVINKVFELEELGDPLPPRYRKAASIDSAVLSMWGDTRSVGRLPIPMYHHPTQQQQHQEDGGTPSPMVAAAALGLPAEGDVHITVDTLQAHTDRVKEVLNCVV